MKTTYLKTKIAGVTFDNRQSVIKYLRNRRGVYFKLVRDKNNKFDENAVAVYAVTVDGKKFNMGFIPKQNAKVIANAIDNNKVCFVKRYGYTGGYNDTSSHGIQVEIIYGL